MTVADPHGGPRGDELNPACVASVHRSGPSQGIVGAHRPQYVMTVRVLAAAAVLVSAAVHLYLWFDGAREDDFLGPAFMLNAIAGAVISALLLGWRRYWAPPFLALGFGLSTLGAFVISTTVGLFGVTSTWEGWEAWTAVVAEVVAVLAGGLLLRDSLPLRSRGGGEHHLPVRRADLH